MVGHIETAINSNGFALGVFLDIQGAFDNVTPDMIAKGLRARNIPEVLIKWYNHYLRARSIEIDQ